MGDGGGQDSSVTINRYLGKGSSLPDLYLGTGGESTVCSFTHVQLCYTVTACVRHGHTPQMKPVVPTVEGLRVEWSQWMLE